MREAGIPIRIKRRDATITTMHGALRGSRLAARARARCYTLVQGPGNTMDAMTGRASAAETNSAYAWRRLAAPG